ncbi:hypothetical protein [Lichenifustis flavocetrariae]|uniref:Uncharacterized protein n=1 Tax=Lichenifustis flavocetrariae TaxID=2949735 RepID=A0AA41Z419_9HYPH|nr:hypothetical protein [Lichenifustis flavocetrariae]MCW6512626.1 hypothetical protein [Lichenifustis flavocetrariae]
MKCSDGRLYHPVLAAEANKAWKKRQQYGADQERLRKWREGRKEGRSEPNPKPPQQGGETPNETEAETRFERVRKPERQGQGQGHRNIAASQLGGGAREKRLEPHHDDPDEFAKVQAACVKAIGDGHPADPVFGPIMILIDRGISVREITTVMRSEADARRARGRPPIKFWSKWAEIVVERLNAAPKVAPERSGAGEPRIDFGGGCSAAESTIISVLGRGGWLAQWGAKPGEAGCKVPERLWPKAVAA